MPPRRRKRPLRPLNKSAAGKLGTGAATSKVKSMTKGPLGTKLPPPLKGPFKEGQRLPYQTKFYDASEFTLKQLEDQDVAFEDELELFRRGAEVHRKVRHFARSIAKPGVRLLDLVGEIEAHCNALIGRNGLECGMAFPCGVSINNVAAHYAPLDDEPRILKKEDIMKVDFGLHVKGRIIDSAFTVHFDPKFDGLAAASREATEAAIRASGPDMSLGELGNLIEEVICSHEMVDGAKTLPIVPVRNLSGHLVGPYKIHAGKSIPNAARTGMTVRMEEGEVYAIETFATTGNGIVDDAGQTSHWMLNERGATLNPMSLRMASARRLLSHIQAHHSTMAFCQRWFGRDGIENWQPAFRVLRQKGLVEGYPPLADVAGSHVSQFEHTLMIKPSGIEVLTRGPDY